jgi:hypothetical protein
MREKLTLPLDVSHLCLVICELHFFLNKALYFLNHPYDDCASETVVSRSLAFLGGLSGVLYFAETEAMAAPMALKAYVEQPFCLPCDAMLAYPDY